LPNHELVCPTEKDFARPVLPNFAAQGALDGDGLEGELLPPGWHVAAATLAGHHEGLAATGSWEHAGMIGEE